jgi:hypothetical protein
MPEIRFAPALTTATRLTNRCAAIFLWLRLTLIRRKLVLLVPSRFLQNLRTDYGREVLIIFLPIGMVYARSHTHHSVTMGPSDSDARI